MKAVFAAAATALLAAAPGGGQAPPNDLEMLVILTGSCERLQLPERDASASCRPVLVNLSYRHGRSSFAFTDGDARMISFSGTRQVRNGDHVDQELDLVTIASREGDQVDARSSPARGSCEFTNPFVGRAFVRCTATTAEGEFSASFTSDGRPPDVRRIPQ